MRRLVRAVDLRRTDASGVKPRRDGFRYVLRRDGTRRHGRRRAPERPGPAARPAPAPADGRAPDEQPVSTERALSFGAVSEDYDRFRPKPAPAALDWLLPEHASAVGRRRRGHRRADAPARRARGARHRGRARTSGCAASSPTASRPRPSAPGPAKRSRSRTRARTRCSSPPRGTGSTRGAPSPRPRARCARRPARRAVDDDRPRGRWVAALWRTLRPGGTRRPAATARARWRSCPARASAPVEGPHAVRVTQRFAREDLVGLAGTYSAMIVQPPDRARRSSTRSAARSPPIPGSSGPSTCRWSPAATARRFRRRARAARRAAARPGSGRRPGVTCDGLLDHHEAEPVVAQARLDRDRVALGQRVGAAAERRGLVDLEPDAVAEREAEAAVGLLQPLAGPALRRVAARPRARRRRARRGPRRRAARRRARRGRRP